jgi:hypothetical protein
VSYRHHKNQTDPNTVITMGVTSHTVSIVILLNLQSDQIHLRLIIHNNANCTKGTFAKFVESIK